MFLIAHRSFQSLENMRYLTHEFLRALSEEKNPGTRRSVRNSFGLDSACCWCCFLTSLARHTSHLELVKHTGIAKEEPRPNALFSEIATVAADTAPHQRAASSSNSDGSESSSNIELQNISTPTSPARSPSTPATSLSSITHSPPPKCQPTNLPTLPPKTHPPPHLKPKTNRAIPLTLIPPLKQHNITTPTYT